MKRAILYIVAIFIVIIFGVIIFWPYYMRAQNENLEKEAGFMIQKVEEYKKKYHKLPEYEEEMHLNLPDDYPINYTITNDSLVYVVGFQIAPFKSMVYYSDRKTWHPQ